MTPGNDAQGFIAAACFGAFNLTSADARGASVPDDTAAESRGSSCSVWCTPSDISSGGQSHS